MLGRVGHQLVRADGVHQVEHAGAAAGELPLDAEQGMLVGRDADAPAARVLDACDLDGVEVLVARAEGAGAGRIRARTARAAGDRSPVRSGAMITQRLRMGSRRSSDTALVAAPPGTPARS